MTTTEEAVQTDSTDSAESAVEQTEKASTYKAGSWQDSLAKSAALTDRVKRGDARAQSLMWTGAQGAIKSWLPKSDSDESGEKLTTALVNVLGKSNKGTASKIVTIAKAVRNNGLELADYPSLRKAYIAAAALSPKSRKVQEDEDEAADEAVAAIAPPKSTSSPEGAAKIVLSKGVDEAARLLLNELGAENTAAHRAFMRAISQETAGRIPKPEPKVKIPRPAAKKPVKKTAVKAAATKAAPVKAAPAKAKPVAVKSVADRVGTKAKPVAVKAKPVAVKA